MKQQFFLANWRHACNVNLLWFLIVSNIGFYGLIILLYSLKWLNWQLYEEPSTVVILMLSQLAILFETFAFVADLV